MATNFEAKLHAFRRTQDGVVVSYVVHPNDVSTELATAALGTRYMVAVAEIGDDGKPKSSAPMLRTEAERAPEDGNQSAASSGASQKERKPFASLPLSQQAAIRCTDEQFQNFTRRKGEEETAAFVRTFCGVASRKDIETTPSARLHWAQLEKQFQAFLTDQKYAGLAR